MDTITSKNSIPNDTHTKRKNYNPHDKMANLKNQNNI